MGTLSANSSNVINLIIDAYNVSTLLRLLTLSALVKYVEAFIHMNHIKEFNIVTAGTVCVSYAVQTKLPDDIPAFVLSLGFWQSLSSEVILENSKLPEGVTIAYTSRCKNSVVSEGESGRKCSNISIGDEVRIRKYILFFVVFQQ